MSSTSSRPQNPPAARESDPPARTFLKGGDLDREKVCPLLLRVFIKEGNHHVATDFATHGKEPAGEVQIYTWKDATLRELTELIKGVNPSANNRSARLSFAFVYPDRQGRPIVRPVGQCWSNSRRVDRDDKKTLDELKFETGDFLDIAVSLSDR